MNYKAWATKAKKQRMTLKSVDLEALGAEDVEVAVEHCGLCHSDLSVFNNEWGISQYPAILGHEVVGHVTALGSNTKGLKVGQHVGVGWYSGSYALSSVHVGKPAPLPAGASNYCRSSRRVCYSHSFALGLGHPAAGKAELCRIRTALMWRRYCLFAAGHVR